jgi:hypothetical protein
MDEKEKRERLREIEAREKLIEDVMDGKRVPCPTCQQPLTYFGVGSGVHPGIYCVNKHLFVLMNVKRA